MGVCCFSEKLIQVIVKSDYFMQEMEKNGPNKFIFAILRHITQIQIDIIINVSFKYRNVKFYCNKKNQVPLRVRALETTQAKKLNFLYLNDF